jgi:Kef-type K+ transport system membrane component KefB
MPHPKAGSPKVCGAVKRWRCALVLGGLVVLLCGVVRAAVGEADAHSEADHSDPFAYVVLGLASVIAIAMLGRWLAGRMRQPPVLGELLIGLVVGNVGYWLGFPLFLLIMHLGEARPVFREVWRSGDSVARAAERVLGPASLQDGGLASALIPLTTGPEGLALVYLSFAFSLFSVLGVLILAFMVGLQSSVAEMRQVGARATLVALVGVVAPFVLGLALSSLLLSDADMPTRLFVAATLCATSVGITARVLQDLGRIQTAEARVILGAAVIDDVLGLLLLAVVSRIAVTGSVEPLEVGRITLLASLFLGVVLVFGERIARRAAHLFESLDRQQGKLLFPIALAFTLAWLANTVQLAAIVGAFAAGLIIREEYFAEDSRHWKIEDLVSPLEAIFAPVFFVLMGMQVNLASFAEPSTLILAGVFTTVAIVGKLLAGLPAGPGLDRLSVGVGMVPRGEVGLIFASIGKGIGVVGDAVFSAIIVMVMLTTFVSPIALRWSMDRNGPQLARG